MRLVLLLICSATLLAFAACSDDTAGGTTTPAETTCGDDLDCGVGESCVEGRCQESAPNSTGNNPGTNNSTVNNTEPDNNTEPECIEEVCNGVDDDCDGEIDEDLTNACGGCDDLDQAPGDECGACGGGALACADGETLTCEGATPDNGCGGCEPLPDDLGGECGPCGGGSWVCAGTATLVCQGSAAQNACQGCAVLINTPGDGCGTCGSFVCDGTDALACEEGEINGCGGCSDLGARPGQACGQCGHLECDGTDALTCEDPGADGCVTRFIAMGDTGEGNEMQYRVAAGAQARCDRGGGCDGFIMLGDNIYDDGAQSPTDEQFDEKIDLPYADLVSGPPPAQGEPDERGRMPIYVSLGNHDLGGAGLNSAQVLFYLEYASNNDWFYYPDEFWELRVGNVHLMSLHTNPLAYGIPDTLFTPHSEMVQNVLDGTEATWTVAFGHHPYRSDGQHGNAGSYEGIPGDLSFLGGMFREWIDENVCNRVDFYISGHDHNRQWLASVPDIPTWPPWAEDRVPCDTHFAVSGAGAKTRDLVDRDNDLAFGAETEGFLYLEFYNDRVEVEYCDADGVTEWEYVIDR